MYINTSYRVLGKYPTYLRFINRGENYFVNLLDNIGQTGSKIKDLSKMAFIKRGMCGESCKELQLMV